ncbi:MAG: hypothetical protein J6Y15_10815 [Bacteroidaceae bacterium]|nr:hypothetical protein [Bacteroidaceae bacterium]
MKKNFTLLLFLPTMFALNANAQEDFEDQLPKSLVVFHNPDVKGIRLDSIVTRVLDNQQVLINEGVYLDRIYDFSVYDSKVVFDYPEDGGEPTRRLVSGTHDYFNNISVKYDKVINGIKLANKTLKSVSYKNDVCLGVVGITEMLGEFPIKETTLDNGVVTSETTYEYNDKLDMTLRLHKKVDTEGNVTGGDKVTVDYKDDFRTETSYKYDTVKKDYVAIRKTVTKADKLHGWITEKYIYDADAEGNFGECSYSLVMDVENVDFGEFENLDVKGVVTTVEDGIVKSYNISTDYKFRFFSEDLRYNDYLEYSVTYKLNDKGEKEAAPFKIERKFLSFLNGSECKYTFVDLLDAESNNNIECNFYDNNGYLVASYRPEVKHYSDAKACLDDLESNNIHEYAYFHGEEYEYQYLNGINIGCTYNGNIGFGYEGGFFYQKSVRDTNYKNVKGSDAIRPVIYSKSEYDWLPSIAYSVFYYSSEDGTLEARNSATAIDDIADDSKPAPAVIYDVQGKVIKTCSGNNITLPEASGIYIVRQGNNVTKMKK